MFFLNLFGLSGSHTAAPAIIIIPVCVYWVSTYVYQSDIITKYRQLPGTY